MDENLQEVNTVVGNLRNMAIDIGTELSNQNRQLERIHLKVRTRFRKINVEYLPICEIRSDLGSVDDGIQSDSRWSSLFCQNPDLGPIRRSKKTRIRPIIRPLSESFVRTRH